MTDTAAHVTRLWRHPVKSMAGEALDTLTFGIRGVHGDRLWALHDVERDTTISARRLPAVLRSSARYEQPPGPDAGPGRAPAVIVTTPDGTDHHSDDPAVHAALSSALDREVRLVPLPDEPRAHRLSWRERAGSLTPQALARDLGIAPDERLPKISDMNARALSTLARNATPPGSFVDLCPVHLLTEASVATIAHAVGEDRLDSRRFRPNILVGGTDDGLPESEWTGATVDLGSARLRIVMKTVRCVVPSRAHVGLPLDKRLTRAVASTSDRYLGVYAEIVRTGGVSIGDTVAVTPPRPPTRLQRVAGAGRTVALDSANRVAEALRRI
ncbi:MOSC domain-containing protein [Gordonia sp. ABSL11-1]|uniref:MOSC domain-containing protein n=1 Tax=Gordonia sp. ABSL11-1 TaxID=3053924 RepID=UPI0025738274|nr:MOSC domain-containing protein [Gordonia sp. ABSL11-1]MDL9945339.1 MOSC domain-containing protein [Gordonia sp. ABSL11-1]